MALHVVGFASLPSAILHSSLCPSRSAEFVFFLSLFLFVCVCVFFSRLFVVFFFFFVAAISSTDLYDF